MALSFVYCVVSRLVELLRRMLPAATNLPQHGRGGGDSDNTDRWLWSLRCVAVSALGGVRAMTTATTASAQARSS